MGDSLRYKDWFEKAAHDLRGAEILMEHDGGNDLVAFHCQQAMEKMLKGWLLKTTGELLDGYSNCGRGTVERKTQRLCICKSALH